MNCGILSPLLQYCVKKEGAMKEIIHVCFSESAAGCIRHAIKKGLIKGNIVISLLDDLSNGPINELSNVNIRIDWCRKVISANGHFMVDAIRDNYEYLYKEVSSISDQSIYIWYAENGKETSGLLYLLSLFKDKIESIFTINVSGKIYEGDTIIEFNSVGEIVPERLEWFIIKRQKISMEWYSAQMDLWMRLQKENADLRVVNDKQITSVEVSYYDEMILNYTNKQFSKCARTVGECIGRTDSYICDIFLFWRVLELIKSGRIEYKGNLGNIREMEIRKV